LKCIPFATAKTTPTPSQANRRTTATNKSYMVFLCHPTSLAD